MCRIGAEQKERIMAAYPTHSVDSAPEASKPALRALQKTFGFLPNIAAAMAESPTLLNAFLPVFQHVHSGTLTEAQVQVVLLTDAVTNTSPYPVALHSMLALKAGVSPADVQAIREGRAPQDRKLATLSALAKEMIETRGHVEEQRLAAFREAGFGEGQVLEAITAVAASTITNYVATITKLTLDPPLREHSWSERRGVGG
jgi:alkylhydroperoxidase family enzyme